LPKCKETGYLHVTKQTNRITSMTFCKLRWPGTAWAWSRHASLPCAVRPVQATFNLHKESQQVESTQSRSMEYYLLSNA